MRSSILPEKRPPHIKPPIRTENREQRTKQPENRDPRTEDGESKIAILHPPSSIIYFGRQPFSAFCFLLSSFPCSALAALVQCVLARPVAVSLGLWCRVSSAVELE